jgi:lycopene cyclase domain-containing protein
MAEPVDRGSVDGRLWPWVVLLMLAMVGVPAAITLHTVRSPGTLQVPAPDPTPHGYTVSLLLFVVPIVVISAWFAWRRELRLPRRAVTSTLGLLVPVGFGLDFFFANRFFVFRNPGATLSIGAPALGGPVPLEEYLFYLTGFTAVLLIYVWLDEYWLAAYNVPDYAARASAMPRLVRFHPASLLAALALVILAVAYKKALSDSPEGFPGYFAFLVVVAFAPAAGLFASARAFVNWRAFSLTLFLIVLVSLVWEVTLAIPYGWWGYERRQMTGLRVGAWSELPIEAVCVWLAVTYATVIVYETVKLWRASGKPPMAAFFGSPIVPRRRSGS